MLAMWSCCTLSCAYMIHLAPSFFIFQLQ